MASDASPHTVAALAADAAALAANAAALAADAAAFAADVSSPVSPPVSPSHMQFPAWACRARRGARDYAEFATVANSDRYSLMPWAVQRTADIYRAECRQTPPSHIVDATAHIGCDTAQFASMFPGARITALEIAPAAHAALQCNMANPRLVDERRAGGAVLTALADCAAWLPRAAPADLVYFDPPWSPAPGAQRLQLGDMQLHAVVAMALRQGTPLVVAKLPPDVLMDEFCRRVAEAHGAPVRSACHDVTKPKGDLAYRLAFVRPAL